MTQLHKGTKAQLEKKAADIIAESLTATISEKGMAVLAVPGGRSVLNIFKKLSKQKLDWSKVHIFMVDERIVPLGDPESNFNLVSEAFAKLIDDETLKKENLHPFIMDGTQSDYGSSAYSDSLSSYSGNYDVVLLSSGEDGHMGALFPDHHSIRNDSEMFFTMDDSPKPPPLRLTSSRKLILKSNKAVVVFFGEAKREALERFFDKTVKETSCPVKYLQKIPDCDVLTDIKDVKK